MNRLSKIAISEYFYSLQGEGNTMGVPAIFLRLTACNLMCGGKGVEKDGKLRNGATWICDTIAVWMQGQSYGFDDLLVKLNQELDFIGKLKAGVHLVITGGEPLLQQDRIIAFLAYLEQKYELKPILEIETNATILPKKELDKRVHYWNTSPKLSNSGVVLSNRLYPEILQWFDNNNKTMFKFVIASKEDFEEIKTVFLQKKIIQKNKIVLMPAADSLVQLLERNQLVADICIQNQIRMCTRMHVEIWNKLTGV